MLSSFIKGFRLYESKDDNIYLYKTYKTRPYHSETIDPH